MSRLSDRRVMQYWDKNHLFAERLGHKIEADPAQPQPNCCVYKGTQWDEVAVYPQGARWDEQVPRAAFLNGPVVRSLDFSNTVTDLLSK
jgi:hypothetical protein